MTFICSKTDDISLEEAQDSLGLEDEMAPDWAEVDRLVKQQKSMKKRLDELKELKLVYDQAVNDADEQIDTWVRNFPNHALITVAWYLQSTLSPTPEKLTGISDRSFSEKFDADYGCLTGHPEG